MQLSVIDVSEHQGNIDWEKVKNAGVVGAMIRTGYGVKDPNQIDKQFYIGSAFFLNIPDTCNFQVVNSLNQIIMPACHSAKADHRKSVFHVFSSFLFCRSRTLLRPCLYAEL